MVITLPFIGVRPPTVDDPVWEFQPGDFAPHVMQLQCKYANRKSRVDEGLSKKVGGKGRRDPKRI